jgi:cation transport ATPase
VTQILELTVPELDCADEAGQIEAALGRLQGLAEVRTAVTTRKAVVVYHLDRVAPEMIHEAIRRLGMTVADSPAPSEGGRRAARTRGRAALREAGMGHDHSDHHHPGSQRRGIK